MMAAANTLLETKILEQASQVIEPDRCIRRPIQDSLKHSVSHIRILAKFRRLGIACD